jgi:hypothetical protein
MNSLKSVILISLMINFFLILYCVFFLKFDSYDNLTILFPFMTTLFTILLSYIHTLTYYKSFKAKTFWQKQEYFTAKFAFALIGFLLLINLFNPSREYGNNLNLAYYMVKQVLAILIIFASFFNAAFHTICLIKTVSGSKKVNIVEQFDKVK